MSPTTRAAHEAGSATTGEAGPKDRTRRTVAARHAAVHPKEKERGSWQAE